MKMPKITYNKAFAELNKIVDELQTDEISIDQLASKAKRANELLQICRTKLRKIESDVEMAYEEE